jgi:hypothetical protein
VVIKLSSIETDSVGFQQIAELGALTDSLAGEVIELDLSTCRWIDGNMCAPLGALLFRLQQKFNRIRFTKVSPPLQDCLSRNGFLTTFGNEFRKDSFGSTITYYRFSTPDVAEFAKYLERHIKGKGIPHNVTVAFKALPRGPL